MSTHPLIHPIQKNQRARATLQLLADHGPLSIRVQLQLLEPKISRRSLQLVLQRLGQRGLVVKCLDRLFGGSATFYRVSRDINCLKKISEILKTDVEKLKSRPFSFRELYHNEDCALWTERLRKKLSPAFKVIREHDYKNVPGIENILIWSSGEEKLKPDILLLLLAFS